MLTPKNKTQSFVLILLSFLFALLLNFIGTLLGELTQVGDLTQINWTRVVISQLSWLLSSLPLLAIFLGIPAWGTENIVYKSKQLGTKRTEKILTIAQNEVKAQDASTAQQIINSIPELRDADK